MSAAHTDIRSYSVTPRTARNALAAAIYASVAAIASAGIFMGAMSLSQMAGADTAEVEIRKVEKQPLDKEWVWKKQSPRFDHMWRVPR